MNGLRIFPAALVLFACGPSSTTQSEQADAAATQQGEVSEVEISSIDWPALRRQKRAARLERGEVATVKFEGEFVDGGLPTAPTRAIPLDSFDISFILKVKVIRILEGQLPDGWSSSVNFGVHSPAILFGLQGIETAEGRHVPEGSFLLTLWRAPDGEYDLEIEPGDVGEDPGDA